MPVQITRHLTPRDIHSVVKKHQKKALTDIGRYVRAKAAEYPPQNPGSMYHRSGKLGQSVTLSDPTESPQGMYVDVGTNRKYARYVEEGTGIYGPKGMRIKPTTRQALAWRAIASRMYGVQGGKTGPSAYNVGKSLVAMGTAKRGGKIKHAANKDQYMMFAKSIRGMRPWHYMRKAFTDADSKNYLEKRMKLMAEMIRAELTTGGAA
jgi:Bacteriophage HK97-gp10, putative tail-component